jgi:chromosome segregation ATPase
MAEKPVTQKDIQEINKAILRLSVLSGAVQGLEKHVDLLQREVNALENDEIEDITKTNMDLGVDMIKARERIDAIEKRLEGVDKRLGEIDKRLDKLTQTLVQVAVKDRPK